MRSAATFARVLMAILVLVVPTSASAVSITYHTAIEVIRTDNGTSLGYISSSPLNQALYRYEPLANALIVNFTLDSAFTSATGLDLITENSAIANFVHLGLVQGRDDANSTLQAGSFHYAYISTTNPTPPGSTPQNVGNAYTQASGTVRTSESAVWSVDLITGSLVPVWTNPDGSTPLLQLFAQSTALYVGGDAAAFNARYPAPITPYRLQLNVISTESGPQPVPEPTSMLLLGTGLAVVARRYRKR